MKEEAVTFVQKVKKILGKTGSEKKLMHLLEENPHTPNYEKDAKGTNPGSSCGPQYQAG